MRSTRYYPRRANLLSRYNRAPLRTGGFSGSIQEKKFYDVNEEAAFDANTPAVFNIFEPDQGAGVSERIGRKANITDITIAVRVVPRVYDTTNNTMAVTRVVPWTGLWALVWDTQVNLSPVVLSSVWQIYDDIEQGALAKLNMSNRERFRILKTKTFKFGPYVNITTATQAQWSAPSPAIYTTKHYLKVNLTSIWGENQAGDVENITTGALYLVFISDSPDDGGANHTGGNAKVDTRVRYLDP